MAEGHSNREGRRYPDGNSSSESNSNSDSNGKFESLYLSRENRQSIAAYLYAFVAQLTIVLVTVLIYFPEIGKGVVSFDSETASVDEDSLTFAEIQAEPEVEQDALETEIPESDEIDFQDQSLEMVSDSVLSMDSTGSSSARIDSSTELLARKAEEKTGFFGIQPVGNRIVYVIDMSISMDMDRRRSRSKQSRWDRAKEELLSSIHQLRDDQEFYVYLFCFEKTELNLGAKGVFSRPTPENIRRLERKLNQVRLGSGTDPRESVASGLNQRPSCMFLLSDGEFNGHLYARAKHKEDILKIIEKRNKTKCPIHTIGLEDQANQDKMISISEETGGRYRFIQR